MWALLPKAAHGVLLRVTLLCDINPLVRRPPGSPMTQGAPDARGTEMGNTIKKIKEIKTKNSFTKGSFNNGVDLRE